MTGHKGLYNKTQLALKGTAVLFCLYFCISGRYPPLRAQRTEIVPVITTEDALQDDRIKVLQDQTGKQFLRMNIIESTVSGLQGEERGIGAILGIMSFAQIVLQMRKRKEDD